ncbi:hypothetical protein VTN49DRAFT_3771 [Thermomyces lanuginosus]|uniref:uncharacterized protein n=1 Tax=Thermomyces lanuginosus TaxID=5541 RepID=UPI0037420F55
MLLYHHCPKVAVLAVLHVLDICTLFLQRVQNRSFLSLTASLVCFSLPSLLELVGLSFTFCKSLSSVGECLLIT